MARVHVWRDVLRVYRLVLAPLVLLCVSVGIGRLVVFMVSHDPPLSVPECLSFARDMGRLEVLIAPFLIALWWVAIYPILLGLRWVTRGFMSDNTLDKEIGYHSRKHYTRRPHRRPPSVDSRHVA